MMDITHLFTFKSQSSSSALLFLTFFVSLSVSSIAIFAILSFMAGGNWSKYGSDWWFSNFCNENIFFLFRFFSIALINKNTNTIKCLPSKYHRLQYADSKMDIVVVLELKSSVWPSLQHFHISDEHPLNNYAPYRIICC